MTGMPQGIPFCFSKEYRMYYPSGYYRRKALAALKGHWQTALLVALIVSLPTMLMQAISAFTGNDPLARLEAYIVTASRDGVMSQEALMGEINTIVSSTSFWVFRGLEAAALLITPCLSLGMYKWLMDLLHGQEQPLNSVFSRMKYFFKALGLELLVILKVLLWMLPGLVATGFLVYPVLRAGTAQAQMAALRQSQGYSFPVMLLMIIPGAIAALRYALSEYIMAENPESKILFCVRRSKELMRDRKKDLFFLLVSFLLWYLLELLIASLMSGILSLVFQMLAGLALTVYLSCSVCAFYLRLTEAEAKHESPDAEPAAEELN